MTSSPTMSRRRSGCCIRAIRRSTRSWCGKARTSRQPLDVPVVPVYIQEKIQPQALVENLRSTAKAGEPEPELTLFSDFNGIEEFDRKVDFYHHDQNWSNR